MKYEGGTECEKEIKIPIPFKLLAISEALDENFGWIVPDYLFDENSKPKREEREEILHLVCGKYNVLLMSLSP